MLLFSSATWKPRRSFWILLFVSLGFSVILLGLDFQLVHLEKYLDSDFFTFWLSGRMNWMGENPYSSPEWIRGHLREGAEWIPNPVFPYPLPLALFLAPLGLLPVELAFTAWMFFSQVAVVISIVLLISLFQNEKAKHFILPILAGAFLFRPTLVTFRNGQLGGFLLSILCLAIWFWEKERWFYGGLVLGLLAFKPSLGVPVLFLVALWLLIGKKYSAIGGIIASDIGLMLLGMLRDPAWMMKFAAYSNQKLAANFGYSPTFWGVSGAICRHQPGCTLILAWSLCLLTVAFTIFLLLRDKRLSRSFLILGLITPVALLVTPYLWVYDQILLVAPIAMFMLVMMEGEKPYLLSALVFITIAILSWALLGLALNVGNDAWSASLPGICIVFYIWVIRTINLDRGNRFQKDAISP
jgi:hypothetical protein